MARILVADDEAKLGRVISEMLETEGHQVARVQGGRAALVELKTRRFDIVVSDLRMPEVDGLAVLKQARACGCDVILMTAYGTAESAVEAMKAGAADYLLKPFATEELRLRVRRLAEQRRVVERGERLVEQLTPSMVAESPAMKAVLESARKVAASDASVLLLGESGTGKTQLARLIHYQSKRAAAPFIEVHCAALPETLLESELFGHEKGAFTGATDRRAGHLARADGGTLFLDEIGEVSQATQVKLLRFLQEREFVPLGTSRPQKVDVRVIAATNADLAQGVKEGTFREDFFYRLNVFALEIPPLRSRVEDVMALADRFLREKGLPPSVLTDEAREELRRAKWPGNVRELQNALERALILAGEDEIRAPHLRPPGAARASAAGDVLVEGFNLDDFERELIHAALERAGGNKTAAAKTLGITRRRLYSRLRSLGEPDPQE